MKKEKKENIKKLKKIDFKSKVSKAKENFLEKLNVPDELSHNYTKITMIENEQILLEGKNSIVDYYDNYIKIQTEGLYIILDGKNLNINEIEDNELLISGNINNVGYIKR